MVPPFNSLPGANKVSWWDDAAPEMLWAFLIAQALPRAEYLKCFRSVVVWCKHNLPGLEKQVGSGEGTEQRIIPMGPEVSEAIKILPPQLVELHIIWNQYCEIYSDAGTVDVLNQNCGLFFKIVQDVLWDKVLLGISPA